MNKENFAAFVKELGELSNKYGFEIQGCGCCGSPHINETDIKDGKYLFESGEQHIEFLSENQIQEVIKDINAENDAKISLTRYCDESFKVHGYKLDRMKHDSIEIED